MSRIKYAKKMLSALIALIMVLGSFTSFVFAESEHINLSRPDMHEEALAKIEEDVINELEKNKFTEVLVYMKDQVDTEMVATTTKDSVSNFMTPYNTKLEVRKKVVEALKDNAIHTQSNILDYLEQEVTKGTVEEFESYYIVNMVYVKATREVIENIAHRWEVERIYKNRIHKLDTPVVTDGIEPSDENLEWNIERVQADKVWDLGYDGTGIVVGSLDSGVDWTHPALRDKWRGYDPVTGEIDPSKSWYDPVYRETLPSDSGIHGTHVMGTILGQEPNGMNKIGVAPGAKWIAARVFDAWGTTTDTKLLSAAQWMLAPGGDPSAAPDVINNSWGGEAGINDWFRDAVRAWRAAGIFPVFAAGNQLPGEPLPWPGSITVPANYPESFAVAAVDINDIRASFSKLGPSPYDPTMIKPEISAPGVSIRSSIPGGGYDVNSGTSMAAPHITGTVALLLSTNVSLSIEDIERILTETAEPLTDETYPESPNFGYGYGMVNCYEAVLSIASEPSYISGKVLVEGNDNEEPIIEHEQTVSESYVGMDIEITAKVSDDISVKEVELLVKQAGKPYWYKIPMERIDGDYKNGVYRGIIAYDILSEGNYVYRIRAKDFAGDMVATPDYRIKITYGALPDVYFQGFEKNAIGWTFNGCWEYGIPSGISPQPYEGMNLVGTVLDGEYPGGADDWLISPPIDLRDNTLPQASLRFYHWYDAENTYDYCYILVSNDYGENWDLVKMYTGTSNGWKEESIDLTSYIGSPNPVYVAFRFTSNYYISAAGWYIDNVRVEGLDIVSPDVPVNLTAKASPTGVKLTWEPPIDGDISHYNIFRSEVSGSDYEKIDESIINSYSDIYVEEGKTYYYIINAVDRSGNVSDYTVEVSATAQKVELLFNEDFEEDDGGFVKGVISGTVNDWQWGTPTSGPKTAASGINLWATNLHGNYSDYSNAYIISPPIVVPDGKIPVLSYTHWYDTSSYLDYGMVEISDNDGATWVNITPALYNQYTGRIRTWINEEIPLLNYSGKTIRIRFLFYSNYMENYEGWYIDNVRVFGVDEPLESNSTQFESQKALEFKESGIEEQIKPSYSLKRAEVNEYEVVFDEEVSITPMVFGGIPAKDAVVTVLETGRSVKVDPVTGDYKIIVPAGEYTIVAEAYGYYPKEAQVTVNRGETTTQNIMLEAIPRGTITGRVVDRYYGDKAPYALIRLIEDPRVEPVVSDEEGYFTIPNVIIGDYTLEVSADNFYSDKFSVSVYADEITEVELGLKRFVGYRGEISYDDGTAESGMLMEEAGNGLAVRFTPEQYGMVKGVNTFIYWDDWPSPGGTRIGFTIYDIDKDGKPYMIGEPIFVDVVRGQWNYIDLSSFQFYTDRDFYISNIQDIYAAYCPATGIDINSPYGDRSFMNIRGTFKLIAEDYVPGGIMMRAVMENSVSTPEITNLEEVNYTNEDTITVEGIVERDSKLNLYVNDEMVATLYTENNQFSVEVELPLETNEIMVTAELNGIETEPTPVVTVIKDKDAPMLVVNEPLDNTKVNVDVIHVIGNVIDNVGLARLQINEKEVEVDEEGNFHHRILLNEGENIVEIKAADFAENETIIERKVIVKPDAAEITNMMPNEDIELYQGDTLTVSFMSEEGGQAYFRVLLDIIPEGYGETGIPMEEVEPGLYVGTWTIPRGFAIRNGLIGFEFIDEAGNRKAAIAPGRVTVFGISMDELPVNTVIIGEEAFDIEFLNANSSAQLKLIEWNGPIYVKLDKEIIVNLDGVLMDSDEVLPTILTYYGKQGYPIIYEKLD